MQINIKTRLKSHKSATDNWLPDYPNPADFRFDYYKLMAQAPDGLARLDDSTPRRVAIVGAGCAGMTAARELLRCGFEVTIIEASERIGGRLYTVENPLDPAQTGMEMGAMRMPFFPEPGAKNCLLEYYMLHEAGACGHAAEYDQFPNPGSAPGNTGIYLNRGLGPNNDFEQPQLILWPRNGEDNGLPEDPTLSNLAAKADRFIQFFTDNIKTLYTENSNRWPQLWSKIVDYYGPMTFDDLVMAPAMNVYAVDDGNFGGFGMNQDEANLLYTIGTGDGSWGAFYSIGALWFIRCTMFGFGGAQLQTIMGLSDAEGLPCYRQPLKDSLDQPLAPPTYQGIQSLVEYLYYQPAPGMKDSLHSSENARLFISTWVRGIDRQGDGSIRVRYENDKVTRDETFDYVFVTSGQWASQMSMQFNGFSQEELPQAKITAEHTQHNISSCKLFFPLTERYWESEGNRIPQVIVTDTYIQDAYALAWHPSAQDNGVMLASYTWEDDSLKLLPFDQQRLVELVTDRLRQITTETVGQDVTEYFAKDKPVMLQWITQPSYAGCAKLYRQRDEGANYIDLAYNQDYGKASRLYFAGENYSVEGGWTEPALRSAIDGVMQLLHHVGAEFKVQDFDFSADYPKWQLY